MTSIAPGEGENLLKLAPVPALLERLKTEPAADFDASRPIRLSRAPGRLDVMGGIADYTGSLVCEATLDRAAALALQERNDRRLAVFSFNLHDENLPFLFGISLDALAEHSVEELRGQFKEPGRKWAGYLAGCLKILHERKLVDLKNPAMKGLNLAVLSTVPLGAGVSSSAAIEVAAMMNLAGHLDLAARGIDPLTIAAMCEEVENRIVGAPCGIMDQVTSCCGQADSLLRLLCQPHELKAPLKFPLGVRAVGIDSRVRHSVGGIEYGRTRCAAFMGHRLILEKMREMGAAAGMSLEGDPMRGYLANLPPDDYKRLFRPFLPDAMMGGEFLARYGGTIDRATQVDPAMSYPIQHATDHHVLEARRVANFVTCLEKAGNLLAESKERKKQLAMAGHLMYASHQSYTNDAMMGAPECDLLVRLVRDRQTSGLYGAKITGGGCGGSVAVLCETSPRADEAIAAVLAEYQKQTGHVPQAFLASSPGAWQVGTVVI